MQWFPILFEDKCFKNIEMILSKTMYEIYACTKKKQKKVAQYGIRTRSRARTQKFVKGPGRAWQKFSDMFLPKKLAEKF